MSPFRQNFSAGAAWGLGLAAASVVMGFAWQCGAMLAQKLTQ